MVHRVGHCIASLSNRFIRMPTTTNEEIALVKQQFYNLSRFPGIIGAIDCTHIRILSPGGVRMLKFTEIVKAGFPLMCRLYVT